MEQITLMLRVAVSLAIVLGAMWAVSRVLRSRVTATPVALSVVARTTLGKRASVVVVRAGERGLLLGVTDHAVSVLGEIELDLEPVHVSERREPVQLDPTELDITGLVPAPASSLTGSLLSPATWRQATAALREKTVRT